MLKQRAVGHQVHPVSTLHDFGMGTQASKGNSEEVKRCQSYRSTINFQISYQVGLSGRIILCICLVCYSLERTFKSISLI